MIKMFVKKIAGLLIILLILSFGVFALMYAAPGDPAEKRLVSQGVAVTKEVLDAERERLGLFKPFLVRYGEWLFSVVRGDFGISFKDDQPVGPKLLAGLKNTSILAGSALAVSL
ncbi:MAG: nickel ABC transporter permease subunit NikB, partial [Lachnospiraceae bacterium]|nr:nickel ABC transporter permease subunit NikB [Lachnospiraceae bacterium]